MNIQPGLEMRYRPFDSYACGQNPPDFSWPYVEDAKGYDLIVCRDAALSDIAYERKGNAVNYYNFPHTFQPGRYYWAVRHHKEDEASDWSAPHRFLLLPDANPFPVPDMDTLLLRIPRRHPRVYTTQEGLDGFRAEMLSPGNDYFAMIRSAVKGFMERPFPSEAEANPLFSNEWNMYSPFQTAANATKIACNMAMYAAFHYLVTSDRAVGEYGVRCLLELSAWDPDGCTSYAINDQAHRRVAVYATLAYDWLYPLLTQEQRERVLEMICRRVRTICQSDEYNIKNLDKSPFDSHGGTAIGYVTLIGLALYGDVPEAEEWLRYTLPLYINYMYPWSNEDGGWAQGTYYWSCGIFGKKVLEALRCAGVIDLFQKTWQKNEVLYPLYCCPEGSIGAFGDNSYIPATAKVSSLVGMLAYRIATPEAKWLRNQYGYLTAYGHTDDSDPAVCCHDKLYPPSEAYLPASMPGEHYFRDIGWVAMHSDLADPERVSLLFKSSWYGSYNHSHPDQNAFIIQAYGEPLAIDSGYYDLYNYPFDRDYTRKTYAHNAITHGNGQGQPAMDILAKGSVTDFLSHSRLALAGGEAAPAYKGALRRARRWLLYLKPDIAVVIDDLAAAEGETTFEFWLNAQKWLHLYPDGTGGTAIKDRAALDVKIQHPPKLHASLSHDFAGTDGFPLYPVYEGHARWPVQKRMWFQTEPCAETCMVTTLDIHRAGTPSRGFPARREGDCLLLELQEYTLAVNLGAQAEAAAGGFSFAGTAALIGPDTAMLINGTRLAIGEREMISSQAPISAVISENEMSISTIHADNRVKVCLPRLQAAYIRDGVQVDESTAGYGCTLDYEGEGAALWLYNGCHHFRLIRSR